MSSINTYKRKDGRYESRIYAGRDEIGRRKYRSFYGATAKEAETKAANSVSPFEPAVLTEMTVGELVQEWLCVMSSRIKLSTAANYRMKAAKHILPAFGKAKCCELSRKQVYSFINQKLSSGLSSRYVTDIVVLMRSVFRYAGREYCIKNVFDGIVMPKKDRKEVRILNDDEQKRLNEILSKDSSSTAFAAAMSLYTGIRIGELCALKWEDIDLKKRVLTVRKTIQRIQTDDGGKRTRLVISSPKSESSVREIPIPSCIMPVLSSRIGQRNCYVMSGTEKPLEPRTLQYRFAGFLNRSGLPHIHFHSLRHMFCTNAIRLGFDIKTLSEILGHSSVDITLNRYVHSSMERKRSCMALLKWSA